MKRVRAIVVIGFLAFCAILPVLAIVGCLLAVPSLSWDSAAEFVDVPGTEARQRLAEFHGLWPLPIDPKEVERLSFRCENTRDTGASWYRIKLTPIAAAAWIDAFHARERPSRALVGHDEAIEGVDRRLGGVPNIDGCGGQTPNWWMPPEISFRASETMLWYKDYYSGVGGGAYSGFDTATSTLWLYTWHCQHKILWQPGNMPPGEHFSVKQFSDDNSVK